MTCDYIHRVPYSILSSLYILYGLTNEYSAGVLYLEKSVEYLKTKRGETVFDHPP